MVKKKAGSASIAQSPLKVLILEDNPSDAKLTATVLERSGIVIQPQVTDSQEIYRQKLANAEFDVILADYYLPGWTAIDALEILAESGKDIPFIVMTGSLLDEDAAECIKRGASDFVLKDRPARLPIAIQRAREAKRLRTEKKRVEAALAEERHLLLTLMDRLPDLIYFKDGESRFTRINRALARQFGLSDPAEAVGRSDRDFYASEHAEAAYDDEQRIIQTGEPIIGIEEKEVWPDGRVSWVSTTKMPLRDGQGIITGTYGVSRDITEHKLADAALRASEERYRLLYESNLAGVFCTTWDGRIVDCNQAMADIMGFASLQAALSVSVLDLWVSAEDRAQFLAKLESAGRLSNYEMQLRRKDGSAVWLSGNISVVPPTATAPRIVQGTLIDITERKRVQEDLRFKTALLQAQSETTLDGILVVDKDDQILLVNRRFVQMWNLPEDAVSIVDDQKLIQMVVPQVRDTEAFLTRVRYLNAHGEEKSRDELELKDGRIFDRYSSPLRGAQDQFYGRIWYFRDISERTRAEVERLRLVTAIEQSAEAVVITNPQGDIEYVNPAFTHITGYSREEALGQNPRILKSNKQDPAFYQQLWETILQGKPWHGELINQRKDGTPYTEQMSIAPVKGPHGEVTHFIATVLDVTERKNLEEQLQRAAKMEAVGRLAGGVAHDFNNLLTVINGYAEILKARLASDQKASEYIQEIGSAGERAAGLTRQLLAFSRRQVLTPQVLDLNAVVSNLEKMLRRLIGEDVRLRTNLERNLGRVKADPGQIEQVLMNLAVNSRDAMPYGGDLTIETSNVELDEGYTANHPTVKPGPHVMLAVSDSGMGMPPEIKAHIFEPFFTTKEKGKGTGLGLATVYGIVKQSEGSIWLYTEQGQGTVFKIYLPIVNELATEVLPPTVVMDSASGTETILLIEDEDGVRSLVKVALASGGYTVLESHDAQGGLELCAAHSGPIDLLLTDVVMPQMSGPAVAEKIGAARPGIKVLFMSGYTDDAIVHHGVLRHGTPFIQKPFSPVALRRKVREVLGRPPKEGSSPY